MASISWSSPVRAIGSRSLTPIPNEIYFEIFDYIEHAPEASRVRRKYVLSTLALVCRFFCALALPRIFKSLEFSGALSREDDTPSHTSFCRAVIKGEEPAVSLARHVRECIFTSWNSEECPWIYKGFLGVYSRAIERMPNIRKVTLDSTTINARLFKAVCSLKSLDSLTLNGCSFDDSVTDSFLRKMTPLRVKSFVVEGDSSDEELTRTIPHMVSTEGLEHLESDFWPVTSKLLLSDTNENALLRLDTYFDDQASLCSLLDRSPRLEKLEVESSFFGVTQNGTIANTSCRNLHTLKCPPSMLYLVSGRPLHTIMVTEDESDLVRAPPLHPLRVFDLLKKSTAEIRELHISLDMYNSESIYQHFTNLQILRIVYENMHNAIHNSPLSGAEFRETIEKIVTLRPPAASITEFYTDMGYLKTGNLFNLDLNQQINVLETLVNKHFPNIRLVSFTGLVRWRKCPHKQTWKPFVLPEHCDTLTRRVSYFAKPILCDYDGFFDGLLSDFHEEPLFTVVLD